MTQEDNFLPGGGLSRRQFLAAGAAAAVLPTLSRAQGQAQGAKIRLGLIGCGGRGTWIAGLFKNNGNYELVAGADYFQDRVDTFGEKFGVPAGRRFTGLSAYKKLLELKEVDAVAIISPPYFHPEQIAAAVEAGKHAYCAKPLSVDVPGCLSVAESAKKATAKKQVVLVDFQTRTNPYYMESVKRVHDGKIGELCFGNAFYHTGRIGAKGEDKTPEGRLRNWVFDVRLSGDIIVEQNIHTLDVMNWVMQAPPISCTGTGGRKSRIDVGDCWDHYAGLFQYANGVGVTFSSKQFKDVGGAGPNDGILLNMFGTKGTLITSYGGDTLIRGDKDVFYRGGKSPAIYTEGAQANIATFYERVTRGVYTNDTVPTSVQSNMVAILGRTSTRAGKTVTWSELLEKAEKIDGDLKGLKA